jgi:bacteriocin biosynthesis cyclodehydratase domain-containing protein
MREERIISCMVLRLDPHVPLIWRTPQSLQFGLDRPRVVLEEVSHADELVIAALVTGVSSSGARMIGNSAGLDDNALTALLSALEPALESASELATRSAPKSTPDQAATRLIPASVVVTGDGETAHLIRCLLGTSGVAVIADEPEACPEFVVIVAHFAIEPEDHGRWLRRDIPHLAVVFGDETVRIGPIIQPGVGPCLYCLERHRTDSDPAWPAMASQLWQQRSALETPLVAQEVAAAAVRLVLAQRMRHRAESLTAVGFPVAPSTASTLEIDGATGQRMLREWPSHPDCGCASLTA